MLPTKFSVSFFFRRHPYFPYLGDYHRLKYFKLFYYIAEDANTLAY